MSAALGSSGTGTPVDLSSQFNVNGIYEDGSTYSTGGLDGIGYSYSAKPLFIRRGYSTSILFDLGPANQPDAISSAGQTIPLPQGKASSVMLLADRHSRESSVSDAYGQLHGWNEFAVRAEFQRLVYAAEIRARV